MRDVTGGDHALTLGEFAGDPKRTAVGETEDGDGDARDAPFAHDVDVGGRALRRADGVGGDGQ